MYVVWYWTSVLILAMLCVIIITRLHAMYQRSRKILIFLIVIFLAVNISAAVAAAMITMHISGEELILSGTYLCVFLYPEDIQRPGYIASILATVWAILAPCFTAWIAVKHFRELRQHSAGGYIRDCFMVLVKTQMLYSACSIAVSCFTLTLDFSPVLNDPFSLGYKISSSLTWIFQVVQMSVLGPSLILSIREYHAKLVADSDTATDMTSIAFQERVQISTGNGV
ncbi:hypothetical protein BDR07DRAFT_1399088 [Suillus spraguei]|nr:hypothetical protein BDR07DRAFT_1399088 [Suillus spraguei]